MSALRAEARASFPVLRATDEAEVRGDAMATLELIQQDLVQGRGPGFWRPARVTRLFQLVAFREVLPRWATSRWILEQAAQSLHHRGRRRGHRAIEIAVETRGGEKTLLGTDRLDARAKVIDHDWVFRQVLLYELGALEDFLTRVASPDLVVGADHIHDWARTPMGAFRFLEETPQTVTWQVLATGEEVTSINIGSASLLLPDECAIGRLVPIDEGGAMFETVPLFVPDDVARRVADDPPGWVAAVAAGCQRDAPAHERIGTGWHDFRLLTDVSLGVQFHNVEVALERSGTWEHPPLDVDPLAAMTAFVRQAMDEELDDAEFWANPWPSVAAALLTPTVFQELALSLTGDDAAGLHRLSGLLASPADEVCRLLALDLGRAA